MPFGNGIGGKAGVSAAKAGQTRVSIDICNVTKIFRGETDVYALDDVSVQIRENEFFTLLGPSGCGKTTLLRLIAGFEHPSAGVILLDGTDISHLPPNRRPVNTVFQNYALFPHISVAGNIAFGLEMLGHSKAQISETVDRMLRLVQMEELRHRRTTEISGGQQQRVALARALAPHPKVLLLDEPLSALDLKLRKEMQIELKRLQSETGITFVFVTHDQEEALTMSDRIAVMNEGRILQVGTPRDIYDSPSDRFVANFIGESNFLSAELLAKEDNSGTIELSSGERFNAMLPQGSVDCGKVSIVIRPEHVRIESAGEGADRLKAEIENIVYLGTDTHYHVRLATGEPFMVRVQNSRTQRVEFSIGDAVGLQVDGTSIQILRD